MNDCHSIRSLIILLLLYTSCKTQTPSQAANRAAEMMYSGVWKNISNEIPKNASIVRTLNCEINFLDTLVELRPLSVGGCSVHFSIGSHLKIVNSTAIQLPDPHLSLGRSFHCKSADYDDPNFCFIYVGPKGISTQPNYYEVNGDAIYRTRPMFRVDGFSLHIYDQQDSLVYGSWQYDFRFSHEDFNAFYKYRRVPGTKVIIDEINVAYPDFSEKTFALDTLRF